MNDEDIHRILARAQQIEESSHGPVEESPQTALLLEAAAQTGVSRESVLQAIRERLALESRQYQAEDYVFAISADGNYHVAQFERQEGDYAVVRFTNGATGKVVARALRPLQLAPGLTIDCHWPGRGWIPCTIKEFLPEKNWIYAVSPDGETKYFDTSEVRIFNGPRPKADPDPFWRTKYFLILAGALAGSLVTWLLIR